jgi:citrate lyase subunit beta / citryl-CoA lyase
VESADDIERALEVIDSYDGQALPVHALIESSAAVHRAFEIAAHPRVASLSFGLMDFVSAHGGAIDAQAMSAQGQFTHPLVQRAKLEIAAACHAHGKVPSHCVVTEFANPAAIEAAAAQARGLGYTRMWSIHPAQIEPILAAFAPNAAQIAQATDILLAAESADWAPIRHADTLHDRASYRYYWQLLQRARASGHDWPAACGHWL